MALGPVKPWVFDSANMLAAKFFIKTMYGWRPVDPFPDHPSGLAVDFMISNLPNGKATGDALAAFVQKNAAALNIRYLIWYRQEWSVKNPTWRPYTSSTNPHTDHVHVTWNGSASGSGTVGGLVPVTNPIDQTGQIIGVLTDLNKLVAYLNNPDSWKRVALFGAGATLIVFGFIKFDKVAALAAQGIGKVAKNGSK